MYHSCVYILEQLCKSVINFLLGYGRVLKKKDSINLHSIPLDSSTAASFVPGHMQLAVIP